MKPHSKNWMVARMMPPLKHSKQDVGFNISESDVVQWLIKQPEIQQQVFNLVRDYLTYDPEMKTWKGVNYEC